MTRLRIPYALPLLSSFCHSLDLKTGATIITLFALLSKLAGVYGLLALAVGGAQATGMMQVGFYWVSVLVGAGFGVGLWGVAESHPTLTLLHAHLYLIDHLLGTLYTARFFVLSSSLLDHPHPLSGVGNGTSKGGWETGEEGEGADAGEKIWEGERTASVGVLGVGWAIKIYFILILYSYALHLRHNTYSSLPLSSSAASSLNSNSPYSGKATGARKGQRNKGRDGRKKERERDRERREEHLMTTTEWRSSGGSSREEMRLL